MNIYRVLLEIHQPKLRTVTRYITAPTIAKAWDEAQLKGAAYNKAHKAKCVVSAVRFIELA